MHQRLIQGHGGKLSQTQHRLKLENVNEVFLQSLSGYFHFKERKAACFSSFCAGIVLKSPYTALYLQKKRLFSVVHSAFIFIEVDRSWISPLLLPVLLCGQDFIYNKGVIYENLKALTIP